MVHCVGVSLLPSKALTLFILNQATLAEKQSTHWCSAVVGKRSAEPSNNASTSADGQDFSWLTCVKRCINAFVLSELVDQLRRAGKVLSAAVSLSKWNADWLIRTFSDSVTGKHNEFGYSESSVLSSTFLFLTFWMYSVLYFLPSIWPFPLHPLLSHQVTSCPLHESPLHSSYRPPAWQLQPRHPSANIVTITSSFMSKLSL